MHATVSPSLLPRRSSLRHRPLALALATCLCGLSFAGQAQVAANQLPTGGSIAGGTGTINAASGSTLTINQTSQRMALSWSTFDIGSASTVNFTQPNSSAVVLNQIQGGNPTQIFGNLNANGQVFLINTNGMIFGSTANINVGGLVASTLGTTASSFMSGDMALDAGANTVALMSNGGTINAAAGGVSLIAGKTVNSGTITAAAGNINLVGADRVVLQFESGGFGVVVEKPLQYQFDTLAVDNSGSLIAPGGTITLQARAAQGLFSQLINQSGIINAAAITSNGIDGSVSLIAQGGTGGNIGGGGIINAGSGALNVSASLGAELGGALTAGDLNVYTGGNLRLTGSSNQIARLEGAVGGDLTLTNARDLGQSGDLTVSGTSAFNLDFRALTLDNAANDFGGRVSITAGDTRIRDANALTLGNVVTRALTATSDGALNLGRGSIDGALSATSNGNAISQAGGIFITGSSTLNAGAGSIALAQQNEFGGGVTLTGGSIDLYDVNNLTVTSVTTPGAGNVNLVAAGALSLPATGLSAAGNVSLRAEGGSLTLGGDISGNTVSLYSLDAMTLRHSITTANTLTVSTASRAINQTGGALAVGGASFFNAGTGSISLGSADNHFAGAVGLTGRTTLIRDSGALTLGTLSTGALTAINSGTLNLGSGTADSLFAVSNGNAIVQTGGLTVGQASSFDAGAGSIALDNTANDFQGALALTGGSIAVRDRNNLAVSSLSSGTNGSIALHAGGALTLPAQAINAGTGTVTLIADGDTLTTAGTVQGGAVTLRGHGGLSLGHDIAATSLTLNTDNDAITQTAGALTVQASTTVNAGSGDIALLGVANDFNTLAVAGGSIGVYDQNDLSVSSLSSGVGSVALTAGGTLSLPWGDINVGTANLSLRSLGGTLSTRGNLAAGNVSLAARDGLTLGDQITAGNTLSLSSSSGGITQAAGGLSAAGATSVTASGAIRLSSSSNRFGGGISLTGSDVLLRDSADLTLTALNVGANGSVTLRAGGALYLPAQTIDTGSLSLFADGGTVSTAGALRAGTIGMTARDGVLLNHDVSATGTLSLTTSNAAIAQTAGVLRVDGTTRVEAGNAGIALGGIGNQFAGAVDLAGGTVQIAGTALSLGTVSADALSARSAGALNLGTGTVRGALTATSGNAAITQTGALSVGGDATFNAGTGAITLASAGNDFGGALALTGGDAVVAANTALRLGDSQLASLRVTATGDLTVEGRVEATAIDLSAGGVFRNVRGADALSTPGGRWLVRLRDPNGGHVFNGLDSGNSAVWNIGTGDAVSQAGNRYAFAFRPVLTVSSSDASKVYGSVADLSPHWRVTGLMAGVAGAYAGDELAGVLRGAPTLDSAGAGATATVAGGPYGITTGLGTLDTGSSGYALTTADTGQLAVTPASLLIQAGTAGKIYGSTANLTTFTARGLLNNDTVTSVEQSSAGRAGTAGVGSYTIVAGNAVGTGLSNYDIQYATGRLTVDPATLRLIATDTIRAPDSTALLAYYTQGLLNGDAVTSATLSSAGTSSFANPGEYAISIGGATGTGLSNYRIEYVPGTLRVSGYNPVLIAGAAQAINALVPPPSMALALPRATATRVPAAYTVSALEVPATDAPATCLRDNVLGECRVDGLK